MKSQSLRKQIEISNCKLKEMEYRQRILIALMKILNGPLVLNDAIKSILTVIKQETGLEAIGIRLCKGEDFPYYETKGFPEYFVKMENNLCSRDDAGNILRDKQGNPILECMCGNVICGRTDTRYPFFTSGGSFWSNCTTKLLASTTDAERQTRTRNRCNGEGYESVALIQL
ncbi:MAG: hypothetical protein HQK53_03260 [Oligoflexia bacterium]|nr:hypothetical protein [Oligoflexia bacterium]